MRARRLVYVFFILLFWLLAFHFANHAFASSQNIGRNRSVGGPLTFQERVAYQRAIEEVYWQHRIWPKENPGSKPPLAKIMPDTAIAAKVEDYLRTSNALEQYWKRPITAEQLQAEMDRMVKQTKQPAMLRELFESLNNDPSVIAECLARPLLVDRFIHSFYASDEQFHGALKAQAQSELKLYGTVDNMKSLSGNYQETVWKKKDTNRKEELSLQQNNSISLNAEEWQGWTEHLQRTFGGGIDPGAIRTLLQEPRLRQIPNRSLPINQLSTLQEDADRFYVIAILEKDNSHVKLATVEWKKRSFEDWWKEASVSMPAEIAAPSFAYRYSASLLNASPCTDDTWRPVLNVPSQRSGHTAVWTGTEMIVWGGANERDFLNSGGRYNPSIDNWISTSMLNAPPERSGHTAIWTGTEMIVWGGRLGIHWLNSGGRYDPLTDTWVSGSISTLNAPTGRTSHTAVWTGSEMIIWGGEGETSSPNTGGRYNPSTDTWVSGGTSTVNAPTARSSHTAIWTGSEMIIWGGGNYEVTGGRYNPSTDSWAPGGTSTVNAPIERLRHTAIWTGHEMIIWGGYNLIGAHGGYANYLNSGGRYDPSTDTWISDGTSTLEAPTARAGHTAIWTGNEMIIWGGQTLTDLGTRLVNTGGRYNPLTDTWASSGTSTLNVPPERFLHTAVWTGTEMIVWGGMDLVFGVTNTGGRYNPSTDSWIPGGTRNVDIPIERQEHTAIWTGSEMIVWGGNGYYDALNSGGRYDPTTDNWASGGTSMVNAPSKRWVHKAIWTGTEMIVWGGLDWVGDAEVAPLNSGGRYDPTTDNWASGGTSMENAPSESFAHTAVWTGSQMIVWGGFTEIGWVNTGGRYDPSTDTWVSETSTLDAPSGRDGHVAVWTGNEMIVWGGYEGATGPVNTGGRYNPATDTWVSGGTSMLNAPTERDRFTAVWTGGEMIVWGGSEDNFASILLNTGGLYNPSSDTWVSGGTSTANAPTGRYAHTAVWTGSEMIIWGGMASGQGDVNTGGRYNPATDTWFSGGTSIVNAPSGRDAHSAIWTGSDMIVWGGFDASYKIQNTGGLYCAVGTSPATPTITITDVSLPEGNRGKTKFEFVITLSSPVKSTVKVNYTTTDGTATVAGNDYIFRSRTAKIRRGETTAIIKIKVKGDKVVEGDESFTINLSDAVGATISDPQGVGTILNDD